jgi:radical SAM superfamily enzyme YgiQ (UPF0313 family)
MRILFYYRGAESFGIEYLSAVLKSAGHETGLLFDPGFDDTFYFKTRIFDFLDVPSRLLNQAKRFSPDIIAFSSVTNLYPYVKNMARLLKKELNIPIIIGGIHATALPELVIKEDCFDIVCVGEGEFAMLELAKRMQQGRDYSDIGNLWVKRGGDVVRNKERPLIADLNSLPFPDKDLFYGHGAFWKSVQVSTSRGCPYHCTFCVNNFYLKRYGNKFFRRRTVDNVIEELKFYKAKYKPQIVDFQDDCFTTSASWLEEFKEKYTREIGIKFLVNIHPSLISKKIVRVLKDSGCCGACMGIESASAPFRRNMLKRNETDVQIIEAARLLRDEGIELSTEFIFGLPQDTAEQAWQSVVLNDEIRPNSTSTFVFYPFPGTELSEYSRRSGLLDDAASRDADEGIGSFHTALLLENSNRDFFMNLSYLLPVFLKLPGIIKRRWLRKICERKTNACHKAIGICFLPFHHPKLFKEKMLNYIRMLWVYLAQA